MDIADRDTPAETTTPPAVQAGNTPLLAVVLERILPATGDAAPMFAGARAAGVCDYAVNALNEPRHQVLRTHLPATLRLLEEQHQRLHGCAFLHGSAAQQEATIQHLLDQQQQPFTLLFHQLINLALEGLLSDPRHGGNRASQGWRLMAYQHREAL